MSDTSWVGARSEIDRIDREIVGLLAARHRVVRGVAREKRAAGAPPFDGAREAVLRAIWTREAGAVELPIASAIPVLDAILLASREHVRAIYDGDRAEETD